MYINCRSFVINNKILHTQPIQNSQPKVGIVERSYCKIEIIHHG